MIKISITEYIKRYANDYCKGDIETTKTHAIVQEVEKSYQESNSVGVEEYIKQIYGEDSIGEK